MFPQDPSPSHQLHGPRVDPGFVRLRGQIQPGGGGEVAGQGSQHKPASHAGAAA